MILPVGLVALLLIPPVRCASTLPRPTKFQIRTGVAASQNNSTSSPSSKYTGVLTQTFKSPELYKKIDTENDAAKQALNWLTKNMGLKWSDFK